MHGLDVLTTCANTLRDGNGRKSVTEGMSSGADTLTTWPDRAWHTRRDMTLLTVIYFF